VALSAAVGCAGTAPASAPPALTTDDDKAIYALGLGLARQIAPLHLTEAELAVFHAGLADGVLGREKKVDPEQFRDKIRELADRRSAAAAAGERTAGAAFLDRAASEAGARKLPTGLVFKSLQEGTGATPTLSQSVKVRYKGSLPDGTVFDSTEGAPEPAILPLGRVIPCWSQALQMMKEGGKARVVCPADLAYGDRGFAPGIPPGATLVFEVELLEIAR
jgi:FKBP-type peptidyl-prolyl cis-trans isomerase